MAKRSKSYRAAAAKIDRDQFYSPQEAVKLAKETSTTKYDSTVEVVFRLGVDPRQADQMVRGTVNLPHGTGKTARVLVFATGEKAAAAEAAGADFVGSDDMIEKVQGGFTDFDAAARIYRRCRQAGVTPRGMVDCMIVAVAYRRGAALLAWDVDMDRVAQVVGVELDEASLRG